jgi:hypothetical protein
LNLAVEAFHKLLLRKLRLNPKVPHCLIVPLFLLKLNILLNTMKLKKKTKRINPLTKLL